MKFILPIEGSSARYPKGNLIQGFAENPGLYASIGMPYHNGWDLVKGYGVPIIAPHDGRVVNVSIGGQGYGNHVEILSNVENDIAIWSVLGHMTENMKVQQGDWVNMGQQIGEMGNSGFVVSGGIVYWGGSNPDKKGTHTHWTTKRMKPVDSFPSGQTGMEWYGQRYLILNRNNGVSGAFDPRELFEETSVAKYFKVNDHGKLGIMILEGFSGTIIFENDFAEYKTLLQITGVNETTPTIDIP